jgi:hypothetical protein
VERLIENRPYRNKMELVSRMILADAVYATIKERIGVSDALGIVQSRMSAWRSLPGDRRCLRMDFDSKCFTSASVRRQRLKESRPMREKPSVSRGEGDCANQMLSGSRIAGRVQTSDGPRSMLLPVPAITL